MLTHLLQNALPARRQFGTQILQGFDIATQHGQRGAQLVADVGDKIFAHLLQLPQPGDILNHQQAFMAAKGGNADLQLAFAGVRRSHDERFAEIGLFQVRGKLRLAHQIGEGLAGIRRAFQPQLPAGGQIPPFQIAVAVEHQNAFLQGIGRILNSAQQRLQLLAMAQAALLQPLGGAEQRFP